MDKICFTQVNVWSEGSHKGICRDSAEFFGQVPLTLPTEVATLRDPQPTYRFLTLSGQHLHVTTGVVHVQV